MTIEYVVVMPALFLALFLGVQVALLYHARSVAVAAAAEGARVAGADTATLTDGLTAAAAFVAAAGGEDVLAGVTVTGTRTLTEATITVHGSSLSVLPGWTPTITQTVSVPVERIT